MLIGFLGGDTINNIVVTILNTGSIIHKTVCIVIELLINIINLIECIKRKTMKATKISVLTIERLLGIIFDR